MSGLHVDVHGDGRLPYLLLVHGFLSSRAQWRPNIAALSAVCTPVTVDLLGHGRAASPADPDAYTVAAYVDRFEALRRDLGAERWFICGQSFGAGLTLRYAIEHPRRIIAQVFTNSISGLSQVSAGNAEGRAARARAIAKGGRAALEAMPFYPKPSKRLPPEIWEDLVADADLLSPIGVAGAFQATIPQLCQADSLGQITVPTLLVNGTREAAFQPLRDLAAREIAGLEVVDLDGGHSVNLDNAAGFNAAVTDFIGRHSAAGGDRRLYGAA